MLQETPTNMLLISLKGIAKKMGLKPPSPATLFSLSDGELEALAEMRSGVSKEVRTRMKDGKVHEVESVELYPDASSTGEIHKALEVERAFAEVITKYADGRKQSAEVRRRKRIE